MENKSPDPKQNSNDFQEQTIKYPISYIINILAWIIPIIPSFILTCKVFHLGGFVALIVFGALYGFFEKLVSFLLTIIIAVFFVKKNK